VEDNELLAGVHRFGENNWALVNLSLKVIDITPLQCAIRYGQLTEMTGCSSGAWQRTEDEILRDAVAICGSTNFAAVSRCLGTRSRIQCRDRWTWLNARSY